MNHLFKLSKKLIKSQVFWYHILFLTYIKDAFHYINSIDTCIGQWTINWLHPHPPSVILIAKIKIPHLYVNLNYWRRSLDTVTLYINLTLFYQNIQFKQWQNKYLKCIEKFNTLYKSILFQPDLNWIYIICTKLINGLSIKNTFGTIKVL